MSELKPERASSKSRYERIRREIGEVGAVSLYLIEEYDPDLIFLCDRGFRRSHDAAIDAQSALLVPALALEGGLSTLSELPRHTRESFLRGRKGRSVFGIILDTQSELQKHAGTIGEIVAAVGAENVKVTNNHAEVIKAYQKSGIG